MAGEFYTWIEPYEAIADALLERRDRKDEILDLFKKLSGDETRTNIDPFTFFTCFNRGAVIGDRRMMIYQIFEAFDLDMQMPTDFLGVPTANHELWQYFDTSEEAVEDCWVLFDLALRFADDLHSGLGHELGLAFDKVHKQENINKANLTRALYWVRPKQFLTLGGKTRDYLHGRYGINPPYSLTGIQYLRLIEEAKAVAEEPFYVLAARAFQLAHADSWWPDQHDYDPRISSEEYKAFLTNPDILDDSDRLALERFYRFGDNATFVELSNKYGKTPEFYNSAVKKYAKAVCKRTGQKGYKGSQWAIAFVGQNPEENRKGDYVWKMRPELVNAMKSIYGPRED